MVVDESPLKAFFRPDEVELLVSGCQVIEVFRTRKDFCNSNVPKTTALVKLLSEYVPFRDRYYC